MGDVSGCGGSQASSTNVSAVFRAVKSRGGPISEPLKIQISKVYVIKGNVVD